ncbi:hypothetical protein F4804DRAFT_237928 [Jackrogersella minutella]|nr:hypothetical protein F4804DRAFT_237928 [Jackrogersella minutella]
MDEEPTLPKLPAVSWDSETQTFNNTRKRARDQPFAPPAFSYSSDPAIFSSDDDPNVENYTEGRHRKKRYIGSWFQQHPTSSDSTFSELPRPLPKSKRTLKRQFDSGVWMGSDNSVDTEDDTILDIKDSAEPKPSKLRHALPISTISSSEIAAREVIQRAIDYGAPTVDLSGLGIESISNATISQLSIFDTVPLIGESFPFESKEPSVELYLSNNPLLRAPGTLFNLEHLTVLTLRNTEITKLPPSIGNLRNLEVLNLSLTRLRCLPWELLDLMRFPSKLRSLNIHPNPFYQPDHYASDITVDMDVKDSPHESLVRLPDRAVLNNGRQLQFWLDKQDGLPIQPTWLDPNSNINSSKWAIRVFARSPVQYSDSRGVIVSKFKLPQDGPTSEEISDQVIQTEDLCSPPALPRSRHSMPISTTNQSRVPSLFELALQSCLRTGQLRDLPSYLPPNSPPHFVEVLDRLVEQSEQNANSGDLPCSVCRRRVAVPLAQWIEWWEIGDLVSDEKTRDGPAVSGDHETAVPFLRRGCSWKCLPKAMKPGQRLPGTVRFSVESA